MPALNSRIELRSQGFADNVTRMAKTLAEVQRLEGLVIAESKSKAAILALRKKSLPRERVTRLLERGSSFQEFSCRAEFNMHALVACAHRRDGARRPPMSWIC